MYHESNGEDRFKKVHKLRFLHHNIVEEPGLLTATQAKNKKEGYGVNSIHHQAVDNENLPPNAKVLAVHLEDGTIEAMSYFPNYPAYSVQYHPEEIYDPFAIRLIENLLSL